MLTKNKPNDRGASTVPQSVKRPQTTRREVNASKSTLLADIVNAHEGGRDGVAGEKASRRGALLKDRLVPAWVVAELPCQKAIVGATYREGEPVFACIKYREKIVRYSATGKMYLIFDKCSARTTFHIDCAHFGMDQVSGSVLKFSVNVDGELSCRETLSREVGIISDQESVENFALKISRGWCFDHYQAQLSDYLSAGKLSVALHKMRCAVETALVRKAVSAWRGYIQSAKLVRETSPAGNGGRRMRKQPSS